MEDQMAEKKALKMASKHENAKIKYILQVPKQSVLIIENFRY